MTQSESQADKTTPCEVTAPSRPSTADDIESWGEYWLYNGQPERVWMRHGRVVFRFGVVRSAPLERWAGPYPVTVEAQP